MTDDRPLWQQRIEATYAVARAAIERTNTDHIPLLLVYKNDNETPKFNVAQPIGEFFKDEASKQLLADLVDKIMGHPESGGVMVIVEAWRKQLAAGEPLPDRPVAELPDAEEVLTFFYIDHDGAHYASAAIIGKHDSIGPLDHLPADGTLSSRFDRAPRGVKPH